MATELAQAYVQIIPSAKGISGSISKVLDGEAASAGTSAGQNIGLNLASKLKAVIAAAGIGKIIQSALEEGGNLQQSFGGLDTIYGDASESMKALAKEAASAGISANSYAEQAVSFGASLKQAFGGDTVKAAEAANTAIMDMADNSAKMGTDITSVQNAYQGFAKQNYTMLDNLKLGYGGTKEEMQRLLNKATELSGVKYNIDNLGDVYSAIHVIQEDLKITGVAADEAKTTFTGSMGAMKAAASNFLANLTLGNDVTASLSTLTTSVGTFLQGNLFPMLGNVMTAIPTVLQQAIPTMFTTLQQTIPQLTTMGVSMLNSISSGLAQGIPTLISEGMNALVSLSGSLRENAGQLIDAGLNLLKNLAQGIANSLPTLIETVPQIIINICGIINDNMPKILATGVEILKTIGTGIINAIPTLVANLPLIVEAIFSFLQAINWLSLGRGILTTIGNGIKSLSTLPGSIMKGIFNSAKDIIKNGISWSSLGSNIINGIINGLKSAATGLYSALKNIAKNALNAAKKILKIKSPSRVFRDEVGAQISAGMAVGILSKENAITSAINEVSDEAVSGLSIGTNLSANARMLSGSAVGEASGGNNIVMNIYGAQGQDVRELADIISQRINNAVGRKEAVFA